ncbi:hypothetical protein [Flavobacterium limnophilum]|uniref:DUF7793 family protein n=1 Tax=Flavobacterium limnophilum TaxID=3003262 RepID=UPI002482FF0E|nr:hypothetical protein [Flavobacterium limnophilum]
MTELENEFIRFWVVDGILCSKFKREVNFDLDIIKKLIETRHAISNNVNQYWCYDVKEANGFSKECRDYADIHGQDFLFACALVINSHTQKFLFNAFLKLKKSKIPFQAFTNKEKAVEWLNEIKAKNEQG